MGNERLAELEQRATQHANVRWGGPYSERWHIARTSYLAGANDRAAVVRLVEAAERLVRQAICGCNGETDFRCAKCDGEAALAALRLDTEE